MALAGPKVSFQDFPAGDVVSVSYSSSGCFSQSRFSFEFRRGDLVSAEVFRLEPQRDPAKDIELEPKRVSLGTVALTAAEVAGLDRLLAFYRANPKGNCTTVDTLVIIQRNGEAIQGSETFIDATCGAGQAPDVTPFPALVAKLAAKAE